MPRTDDRQRDDVGILARHLRGKFRKREFGDIPFAVEGEAREYLVQFGRQPSVLDAFGLHRAAAEVAEMIVVFGRDAEMDFLHRGYSSLASIASFALATMLSGVAMRSATIF